MAIYVNTNVSSLHGRRSLNNVQNSLTTTYQRLSSGVTVKYRRVPIAELLKYNAGILWNTYT